MELKKRKGLFYTADALLAVSILFLFMLVAVPIVKVNTQKSELQYDVITALSSTKMSDLNITLAKNLIASGEINDSSKNVLEALGELYILNPTQGRALAQEIFKDIDSEYNMGVWIGNELIYSTGSYPLNGVGLRYVDVASQTLSGIKEGENITGFAARAFISKTASTKYYYLGGYVGDGDLSMEVDYSGNISSAEIELAINDDFELSINGASQGVFASGGSDYAPVKYILNTTNFVSGKNNISFNNSDTPLRISGGYIRINYNSDGSESSKYTYKFPGIDGAVNLYDSFYLPDIDTMEIHLHYNSSQIIFLNIGNKTVYKGNNSAPQTIIIDNVNLSNVLNGYSNYIGKNVPLRLGLQNVSYELISTKNISVYSVNDISGSMDECAIYYPRCTYYCEATHPTNHNNANRKRGTVNYSSDCVGNVFGGACAVPHAHVVDTSTSCNYTKLDLSQNATNSFINMLLNSTNINLTRAGLAAYDNDAGTTDYHILSKNNVSLINEVNSWNSGSGTCICCGINRALNSLNSQSNSQELRSIVVMTDGQANYYCNGFNDYTGSSGDIPQAEQDAVDSACNAWQNYGVRVYSIGFGSDVIESNLRAVAACGNGSYYFSSVSGLNEIYVNISKELIDASYNEQTIQFVQSLHTKLYSDSYISFGYDLPDVPNGIKFPVRTKFTNATRGTFNLIAGDSVLDARVISYSGPKWTQNVYLNNTLFYNLSYYGNDTNVLGDPFNIFLPQNLINVPGSNQVDLSLFPSETTGGSLNNTIIYTILRNISSYSDIKLRADGCKWHIKTETNGILNFTIPSTYSGNRECNFTSSNPIDYSNDQDAYVVAVYKLLDQLDAGGVPNEIDINLEKEFFDIETSQIQGIPLEWSTNLQVRVWK